MALDHQEWQNATDQAMQRLYKQLVHASEESDFEVDFQAGALTVEFESPRAKFVVSPNAPVQQVWVSALVKSFKLDWDAARNEYVLRESGQTLPELMAHVISQQLGEEVTLS